MRLRSAVIDLMRGAAGASLALALGCSGGEPIHQEPAATLAPLVAPAPTPPVVASPPSVVLTPTPAPAVVTPVPAVEPAPPDVQAEVTPPRRHRRNRTSDPGIGPGRHFSASAACGRG